MKNLFGHLLVPGALILGLFILLLLASCGPAPMNTPLPTPTPTATPPPPPPTNTPSPTATDTPSLPTPEPGPESASGQGSGVFKPLASSACEALADAMAKALGVKPVTSEEAFTDYISGQSGTGCQAMVTGTGADFGELPAVASKLQKMLEDQGWTYQMEYQADGPAGTGMGFRKETGLCLLSVNWQPSADANCPEDQPLASCKLKPEQKLFTIALNCAQSAAQ